MTTAWIHIFHISLLTWEIWLWPLCVPMQGCMSVQIHWIQFWRAVIMLRSCSTLWCVTHHLLFVGQEHSDLLLSSFISFPDQPSALSLTLRPLPRPWIKTLPHISPFQHTHTKQLIQHDQNSVGGEWYCMQKPGVSKLKGKKTGFEKTTYLPRQCQELQTYSSHHRGWGLLQQVKKKSCLRLRDVTPAWSWGWWVELWSSGERSQVSDHLPSSDLSHLPVSLGSLRILDVPSGFDKFTGSVRMNWLCRVFSPCCAQLHLEKKGSAVLCALQSEGHAWFCWTHGSFYCRCG